VIRVVNSTMEKAIRVVSIERGYDPRDFALVAFGGAGGMHACELAQSLGIPRIIVPQYPGALSAFGILVSDVVKDYSRTVVWKIGGTASSPAKAQTTKACVDAGEAPTKTPRSGAALDSAVQRIFRELEFSARADLAAEGWAGCATLERSVDLRYAGQGFELNVDAAKDSDITRLAQQFHQLHKQRYGYSRPAAEIEIVTLRLRARLPQTGRVAPGALTRRTTRTVAASTAPVSFAGERPIRTQIVPRESIASGRRYLGPAIVTEYSATTVVPPGFRFHVDRPGNLLIETR
jgi:N-methylhydantoinase A